MGPGDLQEMVAPLLALARTDERVLVGPSTSDDAGVYLLGEHALVATADFITPVCDDPRMFGRIAAANSLSDVYAMGGEPLFALNLCCFPEDTAPREVLGQILEGAAETLGEAGAALLGGHSVDDRELKFGLAVTGLADPERLLTNAGARPGDRLVLTKPLGTGVMINAYKFDRLDDEGLAPALEEMARLNGPASRLALEHGAHAATDVTGFGLAGHALEVALASGVELRIRFAALPVHEAFYAMIARGVTTGCTGSNESHTAARLKLDVDLSAPEREALFDPQTSGGLLVSLPEGSADDYLAALLDTGHRAALVGEVVDGPAALTIL